MARCYKCDAFCHIGPKPLFCIVFVFGHNVTKIVTLPKSLFYIAFRLYVVIYIARVRVCTLDWRVLRLTAHYTF